MKLELINNQTAKLLKEVGFNNFCNHFYDDNSKEIIREDNLNKNNSENQFSLPTQALVQKWLREKQNIHINIDYFADYEPKVFAVLVESYSDKGSFDCSDFKTYENALEVGIYQALLMLKKKLK